VDQLIQNHGFEKAMDLAVGGTDSFGDRELMVLDHFGLRDGHFLADVGCGSGRLTRRAARLPALRYLGTDVSKPLLNHAAVTCGRQDFRFALVNRLEIPEKDNVADFVAFFSVGTHLMAEQFYVYLEEARRVLRPGGRIVFSFLDLEMSSTQAVFRKMLDGTRRGISSMPINVFFSPATVRVWAQMLGMTCIEIVDGSDPRWSPSERVVAALGCKVQANPFGQSVAVLEKPSVAAAA
jgi:ubiquinone/menaquinone biosynthesis C-methylase UbiE